MWVEFDPPIVPSLESTDVYSAKRFTDICITHLLMHRQGWLRRKMEELGISDMRSAIEFVILNIDYPLTRGSPDDKHIWNAFSGKACYTIFSDYWQTASETLSTYILNKKLYDKHGYGDCEDTSILVTAFLRILNIQAYEVLGMVYEDDKPLGGHGWAIAVFPDDTWRLIESTLDTPPEWYSGYPVINQESNRWEINGLVYEGWIKFDEAHYYEWRGSETKDKFSKYLKFQVRDKETYTKHKAIHRAWKRPTKAIKKRNILSRIRWRK